MKQKLILFLFATITLCVSARSQQPEKQQIAVFAPLYLDSVFDAAGNFRFEKNNIPKYVQPGLEFYQGVQAAIDSLQKRGAQLEIYVFDSRGALSLEEQLGSAALRKVDLIIAHSNASETKTLADAALRLKTPFISATLPNDAGVYNNPYFVLLNSSLHAHVEGIYNFLQRYHKQDKITVFRKPGGQEDQLKESFVELVKNSSGTPLNIRYVDLPSNFSSTTLASYLDSTKRNICIAGTLDESFGQRLISELSVINNTYPVRVIGMPTWDRMTIPRQQVEVVYSTPFYYNRSTPLEAKLSDEFTSVMTNKPGEMYFRGYETTLRFAMLLLDSKKDIASNLVRKGNTVFTQFDIQPVFKDKSAMTLDYFENKHLYFVKVFGGVRNIIN